MNCVKKVPAAIALWTNPPNAADDLSPSTPPSSHPDLVVDQTYAVWKHLCEAPGEP